jgi:hypothetical protein
VGFLVLKVIDLNLVDNVLHINPQEKIHWVKSGDLRGQVIGPNSVINLLSIKQAHMFTLGPLFSNSHVTWILTASNPAVVHVYSSIDMEHRLIQEAHLVEEIG